MKKDKRQITDEELAAYIDGHLSRSRSRDIESSLTDDTLELIGVTRAAIEEIPEERTVIFPRWSDIAVASTPFFRQRNPLAMAGFLGDEAEEAANEAPDAEDSAKQDEPDKESK